MTSFERIQEELNANPVREAQIQKQMILAEEIMHQKRQEKEIVGAWHSQRSGLAAEMWGARRRRDSPQRHRGRREDRRVRMWKPDQNPRRSGLTKK